MKIFAKDQLYKVNALLLVLFGIACAIYATTLPMGELGSPGAGVWPFGLGVLMAGAAAVLLVTERSSEDYEALSVRTWIIVGAFALMGAFIVIFINAGLTLASLAICLVWLRLLARERWIVSIGLSIGLTALFVIAFDLLLRVPMPADAVVGLFRG